MIVSRWTCRFSRAASLAAICVLTGCSPSPTEVFEELEESVREGLAKEFASHFTEESRPFAEALMSLYKTRASAREPLTGPLAMLAASDVLGERIEGKRAFLEVEEPNGARHTIVFELEQGDWKLDIQETEKNNAQSY